MSLRDQLDLLRESKTAPERIERYRDLFVDRRGKALLRMRRAEEMIGAIPEGQTAHVASAGEWCMEHTLAHLVDTRGPCDLRLATWVCSSGPTMRLLRALDAGLIRSLRVGIHSWVRSHDKGAYGMLVKALGRAGVNTGPLHAKTALLDGGNWCVVVVGSANLTENPRIDSYTISTSRALHDAHSGWFDRWMSETHRNTQ